MIPANAALDCRDGATQGSKQPAVEISLYTNLASKVLILQVFYNVRAVRCRPDRPAWAREARRCGSNRRAAGHCAVPAAAFSAASAPAEAIAAGLTASSVTNKKPGDQAGLKFREKQARQNQIR
jgi:hypothetical protein